MLASSHRRGYQAERSGIGNRVFRTAGTLYPPQMAAQYIRMERDWWRIPKEKAALRQGYPGPAKLGIGVIVVPIAHEAAGYANTMRVRVNTT